MVDSMQRCVRAYPDSPGILAFLQEVSQMPPPDITATAEQVQIAQDFCMDYLLQFVFAVIYYAIPSGFAKCAAFLCRVSLFTSQLTCFAMQSTSLAHA